MVSRLAGDGAPSREELVEDLLRDLPKGTERAATAADDPGSRRLGGHLGRIRGAGPDF